MAGILLETMIFYKGEIADRQALVSFFENNLMAGAFILLTGFGGYLGVRAIIDSQHPGPGKDRGNPPME